MTNLANLIALLALIPLLALLVFVLSHLDAFVTIVHQGTVAFVDAGGSLKKILPNIGGYKLSAEDDLDTRKWLIQAESDEDATNSLFKTSLPWTVPFQKWLWKVAGIRFVGWLWPQIHIRTFDIRSRKHLLEGADVPENTPLKSRVEKSKEPTLVKNLLFTVPRPLYVDGVQLAGDNSRVNMLLLPVYRQVVPTIPVYYLQGDFFAPLDTAIESVLLDFFATHRVAVYRQTDAKSGREKGDFAKDSYDPPTDEEKKRFEAELAGTRDEGKKYDDLYEPSPLTYRHWLKLTKAGEQSPIEHRLRTLNFSRGYYNLLKKSGKTELVDYVKKLCGGKAPPAITGPRATHVIPHGIVPRFGFAMVSFRLVDWEPHSDTLDLAKALLAKETEFHKAEGIRATAAGTRDKSKLEADGASYAFKVKAKGEASRFERMVTALVDKKVDPNVAAQVVATQLRTENIRDSKLTTYIEGGSGTGTSVMLPTS